MTSATVPSARNTNPEHTLQPEVIILGAGINGAGVFHDLSMQGISCVLIEKTDYGSGTSAAPSRLIHGGLKYLETGEFGLVAQSALERNLLLKNAPHLVKPLPTTLPVFSWWKGIGAALRTLFGSTTAPRSRGAVLVRLGLWIYDWYGSRHRVMPRHLWHRRAAALNSMPSLTPRIVATATYYDAKVNAPERLVWELIADALKANPDSRAFNSCELIDANDTQLTFQQAGHAAFTVKPAIVVNAAGPWIDSVNASLGRTTRMIGGTKGSHILLDHPELLRQLDGRMIYFEADDGRICLVFDYLGRALVGSTDIPADDPDEVRCDDEEVKYFLGSLKSLLPGLSFHASQIVYAYSGLRPLPASDGTEAGLISRDHSAPWLEANNQSPFPIVSMVGGKWTTYRGFAEEVTDVILKRLARRRHRSTRELPIGGGHRYPQNEADRLHWVSILAARTGLSESRIETLLQRYGTRAESIAQHCGEVGDAQTVTDSPQYSLAEMQWLTRHEHVVHLADLLLRRTTIAVTGLLSRSGLDAVATVVARELKWDDERLLRETTAVADCLQGEHRMWRTSGSSTTSPHP